jgi:hypothetical protein
MLLSRRLIKANHTTGRGIYAEVWKQNGYILNQVTSVSFLGDTSPAAIEKNPGQINLYTFKSGVVGI